MGTIIVLVVLDETPSIDVDHLSCIHFAASKHVEATHKLAEAFADLGGPFFLLWREVRYETISEMSEEMKRCNTCTLYRISFPSVLRRTTPSTTGDLRVSACVYSLPTVYTLISSEFSTSMNFS